MAGQELCALTGTFCSLHKLLPNTEPIMILNSVITPNEIIFFSTHICPDENNSSQTQDTIIISKHIRHIFFQKGLSETTV